MAFDSQVRRRFGRCAPPAAIATAMIIALVPTGQAAVSAGAALEACQPRTVNGAGRRVLREVLTDKKLSSADKAKLKSAGLTPCQVNAIAAAVRDGHVKSSELQALRDSIGNAGTILVYSLVR